MQKILFVDHAAVLSGAELVLLDLAIAYRQTSRVLLFDEGALRLRLEAAGVDVVVKQAAAALQVRTSTGLGALRAIPDLLGMARQIMEMGRGFDLIHANSQKAFIAAAIARQMGAPPVVWHLHDILTARHFSGINRRIAVALGNTYTAKVWVNSRATRAAFVAAGGRENLVEVLYNGVSLAGFEAIEAHQTRAIRTELGVGDAPLIGVFSRLSYWKGQHVLLEAVRSIEGAHVLIVGSALFGEEDYVERLKALAGALPGRVHWLGFRDDIPVLMAACTVVAHTSTEPEPFGRVIVEGQLAGRPVIATAAGGAIELIEPGVTGVLVPPGDAGALRAAILGVLAQPERAAEMAERGRIEAGKRFSLALMLETFDQGMNLLTMKK
jgi:glycosyltransferase involved in cell wall biosynthesis